MLTVLLHSTLTGFSFRPDLVLVVEGELEVRALGEPHEALAELRGESKEECLLIGHVIAQCG